MFLIPLELVLDFFSKIEEFYQISYIVKMVKSVKTALRQKCKGLEKGQWQTISVMPTHADFVVGSD